MRNAFEQRVAATLGPEWAYEPIKLSYTLERQYVPDFVDVANKRIKESKGRFTASDRQKMLAVKAAHPDWEITLVLQTPKAKISKGSKTTFADWCEKKGFHWEAGPKK